jgi:hypothetical protein
VLLLLWFLLFVGFDALIVALERPAFVSCTLGAVLLVDGIPILYIESFVHVHQVSSVQYRA